MAACGHVDADGAIIGREEHVDRTGAALQRAAARSCSGSAAPKHFASS